MRPNTRIFVVTVISLAFQSAVSQRIPVAKTIDTTHHSVVAILRVDSSGRALVNASGVLIHPRVVLTAGHVNFNIVKHGPGGCATEGFVSLANNARDPHDRLPFDWLKDVESHPDTTDFQNSFSDTTGRTNPSMYIDVGLLFLQHPVDNKPLARLPDSYALAGRRADDLLVGVGFGYDKTYDSTFVPDLVDGLRRQWQLHNLSLVNDLWLSTECDTVTNLPFISMYDSGAPLFLGENVVVGIWSRFDRATKPCPYTSCAVRIDNPKVLAWIKNCIKTRLGIGLN